MLFTTLYGVITVIGSKSLYLYSLWELVERFFGYFPQTWTDLDETRNISEGSWCALTRKIWETSPQGLHLKMPKCVLFFC